MQSLGNAVVLSSAAPNVEGAVAPSVHLPIRMMSEERDGAVHVEIDGVLDHRFATVSTALAAPGNWCEFVPLHYYVKACTYYYQAKQARLRFYVGRKAARRSPALDYRYHVQALDNNYLKVRLHAPRGPLNTKDFRIELEAKPVLHQTRITINASFRPKLLSRAAVAAYLATWGRNEIGFSIIRLDKTGKPIYVRGRQGLMERNVMRCYLALKALLDTQHLPLNGRFEARIGHWFDLTEQYHRQLHHMEREEYVEAKRRERALQLELQRSHADEDEA